MHTPIKTKPVQQPVMEEKRRRIFDAMHALVQRYGFSRVTMDDIAKECGMSRPALYQFFKNKQDIYRGIAAEMMAESKRIIALNLGGDAALDERLFGAIKLGILDMVAEMEATSHGAELLDLKSDLSGDILAEFGDEVIILIAATFARDGRKLPVKAETMAANLFFWLEGMKQQIKEPKAREAALKGFVEMQIASMGNQQV
ncbi:MAG: TetR/AcrR family transcriptional regulator [Salaquimonas sp.]